ncbi:type II toxin-antitoxin system prevent-host-death family antitoxin [Brachybacterium sp. J144]|uniref:type II toxin-antitoxin system prevent-host-death family antitoxin n=1 Tax=Brachybacterium sp. J144 TaxID=3116487 RepID=UPI002E772090|nr:type II toxin-antitoxin system prevent-host-death family antitoxin [Brachybacterium sp. J144]MEE1650684.1 type II toxin-antitoxin system prevent-host-death family antitoxin [Brachybacterium sp. J144]
MKIPVLLTAARAAVSNAVVSTAEFRARLSEFLERANHQPVKIVSRGARPRGVLVSADFFERACEALGDEPYTRPPKSRDEQLLEDALDILEGL